MKPAFQPFALRLGSQESGSPGKAKIDDPLPSWAASRTRQAILHFVERVTDRDGPEFVPPARRIATFDNDGTLWSEKPYYFQLAFAIQRIRTLAPEHPEWQEQQPFKAALEGNLETLLEDHEHASLKLLKEVEAGTTTAEFDQLVRDWLAKARHPRWDRPYTDLVFQPMLELLDYLRAHQFTTYITSGASIEFMRPWTEEVYGIPPEQVIGSSIKTKYEWRDGESALVRLPEISFVDDEGGKPVGINQRIGRRPIAAFGNSDGDRQMLQWATTGQEPGFGLIVHHTDAAREYAYDRDSAVGQLDKALDEAPERGWTIADMQRDWQIIFPFER